MVQNEDETPEKRQKPSFWDEVANQTAALRGVRRLVEAPYLEIPSDVRTPTKRESKDVKAPYQEMPPSPPKCTEGASKHVRCHQVRTGSVMLTFIYIYIYITTREAVTWFSDIYIKAVLGWRNNSLFVESHWSPGASSVPPLPPTDGLQAWV